MVQTTCLLSPRGGDYLVGENGTYDTIQQAVDAAPGSSNDASRDAGALVYITPSYDESKEEYPVVIEDKQVSLVGHDRSSAALCPGDDTPALVLRGVGSSDYRNKRTVRNIRIEDGKPGIKIEGCRGLVIDSCIFRTPKDAAIKIDQHPDTKEDSVANIITRCNVYWAQGNGFHVKSSGAGHSTQFYFNNVTNATGKGYRLYGANANVVGGVVQGCDKEAIEVCGHYGNDISNVYFEKNGKKLSYPHDISIEDGANGTTVSQCYSFSYNCTKRVVNVDDANKVTVRDMTCYGYGGEGEIVGVHPGGNSVEVMSSTHYSESDIPVVVGDTKHVTDFGRPLAPGGDGT